MEAQGQCTGSRGGYSAAWCLNVKVNYTVCASVEVKLRDLIPDGAAYGLVPIDGSTICASMGAQGQCTVPT